MTGSPVQAPSRRPPRRARWPVRIPGLTARHTAQLMIQLSDLLEAGCPLSRALEAISRQARGRRRSRDRAGAEGTGSSTPLAQLAETLHVEIVNGASLAASMERLGAHFSEVQIAMVRAAEAGGFLQQTLSSLAESTARQLEAVRQVRSKLAYPALLAVTAGASVIFLLTYVVPRFQRVYRAARQVMPLPTRMLLAVSGFVAGHWLVILAAAIGLIVAGWALLRWERFRARWDALVLRLPLVGPIVRDWEMSRFGWTMSLLLRGGITVLRGLRLAGQTAGNRAMRREVQALASAVERGETLGATMRRSGFFDATTVEMIAVSEASGKLSGVLRHLAEQRYRDFRNRTETVVSLVEPIIILLVGGLVGLTVVALLLPVLLMFSLVG